MNILNEIFDSMSDKQLCRIFDQIQYYKNTDKVSPLVLEYCKLYKEKLGLAEGNPPSQFIETIKITIYEEMAKRYSKMINGNSFTI